MTRLTRKFRPSLDAAAWQHGGAALARRGGVAYHAGMSRIAYVNGRYVPLPHASVHVEDRGYQFADGIYEVIYRHRGRLIDRDLHLARLDRSLRELRIAAPMSHASLLAVLEEVARRNRLETGLIYMQVTRGVAPRLHPFPPPGTKPSLVVTMRRAAPFPSSIDTWHANAVTLPDQRWARCDIKSVALLPNVLAKQAAREAGAYEAILVDADGMVTEGASTSVFIVDAQGVLRTRKLTQAILPGCTRAALLAELHGVAFREEAFSLAELKSAREVFITAATNFVKPIIEVDGAKVGAGVPGPVARQLFATMISRIEGNG
jgi:D-alanine transaminase